MVAKNPGAPPQRRSLPLALERCSIGSWCTVPKLEGFDLRYYKVVALVQHVVTSMDRAPHPF